MSLARRRSGVTIAAVMLALIGSHAASREDDSAEAQYRALFPRANQLYKQGDYQRATELYERVVDLAIKAFGPDHPDSASSLSNLAALYKLQGRYVEAEPLCRRSLKIREARLGPDHPDVATSLSNLAGLYILQGRYAEAEPLCRRSLKIREAEFGPDHLYVAESLNDLAFLYESQGRYAEAEPLYRRSLKVSEAELGPGHLNVANRLNNLALLYKAQGRDAEAEPLYRRSLKILVAELEPDHPYLAKSLNGLAFLYKSQGRYAEAEPLYWHSLKIREARLGPDHPDVATSLNNLAALYDTQGRYAAAEPLYQRSLKISEAKLGPDHPHVATSLSNLACLYMLQGRYAEAEPLCQRSLKIREAKLGPDHPDVTISLSNLACLYMLQGRYAEAEPLCRRSLKISEAKLGPDHPDVATGLSNLAALYELLGHSTEAVSAVDRARRTLLRHDVRVLPSLSEKEQLIFLRATEEFSYHAAISLALVHSDDRSTAELSSGWVLNRKALTQQTLVQRALLARDGKDLAAAGIVNQLRDVRNKLAALTQATPLPGQADVRLQSLEWLVERDRELSKELGQVMGRPTRDDPWVAQGTVRQALPADVVLIEIARFAVFDFQTKDHRKRWLPPRYAAWVIPAEGRGEIRLIDLGPAAGIDSAVAAAREVLNVDVKVLRSRGEPEVEKQSHPALEALGKLVLSPLLPQIDRFPRWIVSPDAALWLVPWAAMPLEDGRYAIEAHQIHYVVSGRDLVQASASPAKGQVLVMADPDFDLDPRRSLDATRQVLRNPKEPPAAELALRGLSRGLSSGSVPRLPGTAVEARAITPMLAAFAGTAPIVYSDQWALEAVFKAFRRPRVVVLSTHGYFLEDQETKPEDRPPLVNLGWPGPWVGPLPENPLLRCGLLLAGCNRREQAGQAGSEDGVLTGLEIAGTDLRGTELVVLSACETGLGMVHNGEGVAGLRQAFQLAGAQAVVATLWQVPDKESARLMIGFFERLAAGQGKAQALREAQLEQIRSRRQRYGAAHPFFWAAYTLTGQDG